MKGLAEFLRDRNWSVSGSDTDPAPDIHSALTRLGITLSRGHAAENVPPGTDVVLYSPAVSEQNIERQAAERRGIPTLSYIEALGELTSQSRLIAIAGTHGKSSTTAMLGTILQQARRSPTILCGAESSDTGRNGTGGQGEITIVEACEFRRHFLTLHPEIICLLGIEPDHFDCYPTLESAVEAYAEFARRLPPTGTLVHRDDCPATCDAIRHGPARRISFSLRSRTADWQAASLRPDGPKTHFELLFQQRRIGQVTLPVPGEHNVLNAVAAAACAAAMGVSPDEIVSGLEAYRGLKRRMELKQAWRNSLVYDDYAHHPTELRAAISTVRAMHPDRKLIAVFQSHQAGRTQALLTEFAVALSLADEVLLLPIFAAREKAGEEHQQLAQKLRERISVPVRWISTLDQVWGTLQTDAESRCVILTLGAGNLTRVHHEPID